MIRVTGVGYGLLLLLYGATGCRSERIAFQFQPVMTPATIPAPEAMTPAKSGGTSAPAYYLAGSTPTNAVPPAPGHKFQRQPLGRRNTIPVRHLIVRGLVKPDKAASTSRSGGLARSRQGFTSLRNRQPQKLSLRPAATANLDETAFIVGALMFYAALILGLSSVLSGNVALLLGIIGLLLAGAAYGGFKRPTKT